MKHRLAQKAVYPQPKWGGQSVLLFGSLRPCGSRIRSRIQSPPFRLCDSVASIGPHRPNKTQICTFRTCVSSRVPASTKKAENHNTRNVRGSDVRRVGLFVRSSCAKEKLSDMRTCCPQELSSQEGVQGTVMEIVAVAYGSRDGLRRGLDA
ncbi:hypothetical protein BS50DRAFT_348986 [Corynespora cassiicola Philippines]|uniref:Uncharacterized protein n=1 Tax=Corynespora cassiicola Philippines TaxID=1448308 RepID=A0A2T2NRS7_CORCC|nr:hypothetical protein BS50DRAFT_348986 [Corynespora cassiicola Philippines]